MEDKTSTRMQSQSNDLGRLVTFPLTGYDKGSYIQISPDIAANVVVYKWTGDAEIIPLTEVVIAGKMWGKCLC